MSQVAAPVLSKIIARFLLNAELRVASGVGSTTNNLNKFLSSLGLRPPVFFRKFLKNIGRLQPCPLDVFLENFSRTQGGFRAARWMLFVAGRLRLSADSRFRFRLFASATLNHELKTVSPSTGATNP